MDVEDWPRALGFERIKAAFRENDVDAELLLGLTDDDLKDNRRSLARPPPAACWKRSQALRPERAPASGSPPGRPYAAGVCQTPPPNAVRSA